MNEECKNCAAMETCITACEYGSIMCMMNRIRTGQTKGALKNAEDPSGSETAALRQQLAEKGKKNAGLITRCNHLMVKSTDLEDKLARVTTERDKAIDEIYYMGKRFNDCPTCNAYRTPECSERWNARKDRPSISCWEWRGLKKEDTENDNI